MRRHSTSADQAQHIARLYVLGLSATEVSAITELSTTMVLAVLREIGMKRSRQLSARLAWRTRHVIEPLMADWHRNHLSIWRLIDVLATSHENWFPRGGRCSGPRDLLLSEREGGKAMIHDVNWTAYTY